MQRHDARGLHIPWSAGPVILRGMRRLCMPRRENRYPHVRACWQGRDIRPAVAGRLLQPTQYSTKVELNGIMEPQYIFRQLKTLFHVDKSGLSSPTAAP